VDYGTSIEKHKELEFLKQLIGEWAVGIAINTAEGAVVSGCGEMSAVEIVGLGVNSALNMHIDDYHDYFENDLWGFDHA